MTLSMGLMTDLYLIFPENGKLNFVVGFFIYFYMFTSSFVLGNLSYKDFILKSFNCVLISAIVCLCSMYCMYRD